MSPLTRIFIDFLLFRRSAAVTVTVSGHLDILVSPETGALDSTARLTACSLAVNTEFPSPYSSTSLLL